jgi:hypothetical protein
MKEPSELICLLFGCLNDVTDRSAQEKQECLWLEHRQGQRISQYLLYAFGIIEMLIKQVIIRYKLPVN